MVRASHTKPNGNRKWTRKQLKKFQATMAAKRANREPHNDKQSKVSMETFVLAKRLDKEIHQRVKMGGHIDNLEATAILLVNAIISK